MQKRVAVLRGGPSAEYDISLQTGRGVLDALGQMGHVAKDVVIDRAGNWLVDGFMRTPEQALSDIDVTFIALHGQYGEDGTVQRLLERYKVPYTGSGPLASALAMNKYHTKERLKDLGITMPQHLRVTRSGTTTLSRLAQSISELFGPEYVIKPVSGGSSIDTEIVTGVPALNAALAQLLQRHEELLVEERIKGREATVGVLEDFRGEPQYVLPEIEIVPPVGSDFFAADVKYTGETQEIVPGRFSKAEKQQLKERALEVHAALNLSQYSRSDFIVTDDDVYFLEVNTLPGLTSESLFPKSMTAVGSGYAQLVNHLVQTAR